MDYVTCLLCRGRGRSPDLGTNTDYYLYSGKWYYMKSPDCLNTGPVLQILRISSDGNFYSNRLDQSDGGVQF